MFEIDHLGYRHILKIDRLMLDRPVTCIVGPSGSGKTTLLRMLNRLLEPDSGSIRYRGEPLETLDPVLLRRRVVMVGQTPVLYGGTVEQNLQIGLRFSEKPPADREQMHEALRQVKLEKELSDSCGPLSGGERQRLCLARALLLDAETYLLDEPTSSLDRETERAVMENLAQFAAEREKQLILVTHSAEIAALYQNSLVRLEGGRTEGYQG